jgi:hypothetical protein
MRRHRMLPTLGFRAVMAIFFTTHSQGYTYWTTISIRHNHP